MHIALLKADVSTQGGLEKSIVRLSEEFSRRGARISLLLAPEQLKHGPRFIQLERYDRYAQTWIQNNRPDLVLGLERNRIQTHLRAGNGLHAAYLRARGWGKRILSFFSPLHAKILELERAAFSHPGLQKVFVNSYKVKNEILCDYHFDPDKISVFHNGVEWHEMEPAFTAWPNAPGRDPSRIQLLFIGNGYARKGLKPLLFALAHLKERDFHLSILGKEHRINHYRALAHSLNLSQHVTFFGPRSDIRTFYQIADILIIPSLYDPFANVTVEALAMGLFVISSEGNGGHEILTPNTGSTIRNLHDPDQFATLLHASFRKKTMVSSYQIRQSVKYLDFSVQLSALVDSIFQKRI
jgi:UDP-glucose:(heptosyl)LPS alpha-1,3-glucosyltransferase